MCGARGREGERMGQATRGFKRACKEGEGEAGGASATGAQGEAAEVGEGAAVSGRGAGRQREAGADEAEKGGKVAGGVGSRAVR